MIDVKQITVDKWKKLCNLSDAIVRAKRQLEAHPSWYNAAQVQHLEEQRKDLRATVGFAVIEGGRKDGALPERDGRRRSA